MRKGFGGLRQSLPGATAVRAAQILAASGAALLENPRKSARFSLVRGLLRQWRIRASATLALFVNNLFGAPGNTPNVFPGGDEKSRPPDGFDAIFAALFAPQAVSQSAFAPPIQPAAGAELGATSAQQRAASAQLAPVTTGASPFAIPIAPPRTVPQTPLSRSALLGETTLTGFASTSAANAISLPGSARAILSNNDRATRAAVRPAAPPISAASPRQQAPALSSSGPAKTATSNFMPDDTPAPPGQSGAFGPQAPAAAVSQGQPALSASSNPAPPSPGNKTATTSSPQSGVNVGRSQLQAIAPAATAPAQGNAQLPIRIAWPAPAFAASAYVSQNAPLATPGVAIAQRGDADARFSWSPPPPTWRGQIVSPTFEPQSNPAPAAADGGSFVLPPAVRSLTLQAPSLLSVTLWPTPNATTPDMAMSATPGGVAIGSAGGMEPAAPAQQNTPAAIGETPAHIVSFVTVDPAEALQALPAEPLAPGDGYPPVAAAPPQAQTISLSGFSQQPKAATAAQLPSQTETLAIPQSGAKTADSPVSQASATNTKGTPTIAPATATSSHLPNVMPQQKISAAYVAPFEIKVANLSPVFSWPEEMTAPATEPAHTNMLVNSSAPQAEPAPRVAEQQQKPATLSTNFDANALSDSFEAAPEEVPAAAAPRIASDTHAALSPARAPSAASNPAQRVLQAPSATLAERAPNGAAISNASSPAQDVPPPVAAAQAGADIGTGVNSSAPHAERHESGANMVAQPQPSAAAASAKIDPRMAASPLPMEDVPALAAQQADGYTPGKTTAPQPEPALSNPPQTAPQQQNAATLPLQLEPNVATVADGDTAAPLPAATPHATVQAAAADHAKPSSPQPDPAPQIRAAPATQPPMPAHNSATLPPVRTAAATATTVSATRVAPPTSAIRSDTTIARAAPPHPSAGTISPTEQQAEPAPQAPRSDSKSISRAPAPAADIDTNASAKPAVADRQDAAHAAESSKPQAAAKDAADAPAANSGAHAAQPAASPQAAPGNGGAATNAAAPQPPAQPGSQAAQAVAAANGGVPHSANNPPAQTDSSQTGGRDAIAPALDVAQMAARIVAKAKEGDRHFDIRLDPPELGRVDVHLTVTRDGQAEAHVVADKPQTLDSLQRDQQTLHRALKDAGLQLGSNSLNFSLKGQDRGDGGMPRYAPPRPQGGPTGGFAETVRPIPFTPGRAADGRLDIRV